MGINNFKKLEQLEIEKLSMRSDLIKQRISSNMGAVRFVTDIIELYFPKMIDLFVGLSGGEPGSIAQHKNNKRNKYPDMR